MENRKVGCTIVISRSDVLGIVTRYDFIHNLIILGKDPKKTKVEEIMHARPISIEATSTATDALRKMIEKRVDRLVVLSGKKILGVISIEDVVASLSNENFLSLSHAKYEQIFELVRRLTPNLIARYDGEEKEELQREMKDEVKALLRLLEEAEITLRR